MAGAYPDEALRLTRRHLVVAVVCAFASVPVQAGGGQDVGAAATGTNCAKPNDPNTSTSIRTMFVRASFPS